MRIIQTILAAALLTLDRDEGPLECVADSIWNIGIREQSQGEVCCLLRGDGLRGHEGADHGGKYLWWKAGLPWRQGDTTLTR